jgi:hypothetical protein
MSNEIIEQYLNENNCKVEIMSFIKDGKKVVRYECSLCRKPYEYKHKYIGAKIKKKSHPCRQCGHRKSSYTEANVIAIASKLNLEILNDYPIPRNQENSIKLKCNKCSRVFEPKLRSLMKEGYRGCNCNHMDIQEVKELLKKNNLVFSSNDEPQYIPLGSRKSFICTQCHSNYEKSVKEVINKNYKCKLCNAKNVKDLFCNSLQEFGFVPVSLPEILKSNTLVNVVCKVHRDVSIKKKPSQLNDLKKKNQKPRCIECEKQEYLDNLKIKARNSGLVIHYSSVEAIKGTKVTKANDYKKSKVQYTCIDNGHVSETTASTIYSDGTGCNKCNHYKGEELTRKIFEKYFNKQFLKERIEINGSVYEFDGVCGDLAFEYQGEMHYKFNPHFHRDETEFTSIQQRDMDREKFWSGNGKHLFTVKYFQSRTEKEMFQNIRDSFKRAKFELDEQQMKVAVKEVYLS